MKFDLDKIPDTLFIGLDEIFLLELFNEIISCKYGLRNDRTEINNCKEIIPNNILTLSSPNSNFIRLNIIAEMFTILKDDSEDSRVTIKNLIEGINETKEIVNIQYHVSFDDLIKNIQNDMTYQLDINNLDDFFNNNVIKIKDIDVMYYLINVTVDYIFLLYFGKI